MPSCPATPLLLVADLVADMLQRVFQIVGGVGDLGGVVDDVRRKEHDQLGARLGRRFLAEGRAQDRDAMQEGNAAGRIRIGFLNDAADGYRVPVLHRDLSLEAARAETGGLHGAGRGLRAAHFLID